MSLHVQYVAIDKSYEVSIANPEVVMSRIIVQVDIGASSLHNQWDVILADEGHASFEASSTTEGMHDVAYSKYHITENSMLRTNFMIRQAMNVHWHLGTDYTIIYIDTLTEEDFM